MCCIEENKKRDFERLYEQEQWEKLKMLLTENAEEVSCLLTPGELRQMMETSGRPQKGRCIIICGDWPRFEVMTEFVSEKPCV